ncbi:MAG: HAD family phosphatase [Verrucomicrobia bacterium]|nr:HAD family phosphatase [Verrucomicrobiota bacterium]
MKKTVFFDLGNVILFFDHQKMFRQVAEFCQIELKTITDSVAKYFDPFERGDINSRTIHHLLCEATGKKLDYQGLQLAMSDIFQPNEPMVSLIKKLKKNKVPLFLLSNTCDAHFDYAYTHYPVLHLFDGYVLSYEVGARKPEKKIFEKALAIAACRAEDSFYTDDVPEYIEAAKQLNIDAEVFTHHNRLTEHLIARGFIE